MKKILLIGELNQIMGSLNQHLSTGFKTQMCMENPEYVKAMDKIFKPDLVLGCLAGKGELDFKILDYFHNKNVSIPILLMGSAEACSHYQSYYDSGKVDFIIRPTTLGMLLQKCEEILQVAHPQESINDTPTQAPAMEKKTILAVDDSGILLRSVKAMLEKEYNVIVANSGMVAIRQAKKKLPDLILLDYEMPQWDGKRTLEEIRADEELSEIPVIFLTAVSDKANIAAVLKLKPAGYLLKPIEQKVLLDTIEKTLIEI